jgi:hypothetical protein
MADALKRLSSRPAYGIRKRVKEIARFYRLENVDQRKKREDGLTGYLQFAISPDVPEVEIINYTDWALAHVS